jgi:hypothetical protein
MMGLYRLYKFDPNVKQVIGIIRNIVNVMDNSMLPVIEELKDQFPRNHTLGNLYEFLMNLKCKFVEFHKLQYTFKIDGEEMEEAELNDNNFYRIRRYCVIILGSIEQLYDDLQSTYLLEKYRRLGYLAQNQEQESRLENQITSHDVERKYSINLYNYELSTGLIQDSDVDLAKYFDEPLSKADVADMFRIRYIESKKKLLLLQKKTIIQFMKNSAGHYDCFETFCDFFEASVIQMAPDLFNSNGQLHKFWLDPFYYTLLRIWNNMLTGSDDVRSLISDQFVWKDYETLEEANSMQKVFTIVFKLYQDLVQITQFKTFFDRNWSELWDIYFNISDIFKNVCEKNNQTCKVFFNHFRISFNLNENAVWYTDEEEVSASLSDLNDSRTPLESSPRHLQIREVTREDNTSDHLDPPTFEGSTSDSSDGDSSKVLPKQGTFLEFHKKGFLVLKENLIQTLSIICKNKKPYISRIDFSELYPNMSRQFDVFTEMINGPCSMNQELLIENFNLGDLQVI